MPALQALARVDIHQTRKTAPAELIFLLRRNFARRNMPEKEMPALQALPFLWHASLYHKIFFQKSKKSY